MTNETGSHSQDTPPWNLQD